MKQLFIYFLVNIVCLFCSSRISGQSVKDTLQKVINIDSLSADDQDLLLQNKDSFTNDFYDVLEIFNISKLKKTDTTVYDMDRSSHVETGLGFVSRQLINGREISLSTTKGKLIVLNGVGFYPNVVYYHKTGIYAAVSATFYTDSAISRATPVPVVSPSAGYQYTFFKRWFVSAGFTRNFITYGSKESRLLLNNAASLSSSVDIWKKFIFGALFSAYWSSDHNSSTPADEKSSLQVLLSLRKDFIIHNFIGAKEFTISPALNFYFANDNRTYVAALAVTDVKKNAKRDTVVKTENTNDFFGFLDLEPSINFDWRIRNLDINLTPALAIPFNIFEPAKNKRDLNPKVYRFCVQAGIKYLFCIKKKHSHKSKPFKIV